MKYLISALPETAEPDTWGPAGEPVIPWYPAPAKDAFLAIPSFKLVPYATVVESNDIDPDNLAEALKKQYPGLPDTLHENYVLSTAMAAAKFGVGTKLQIFCDKHSARLKVVGKDEYYELWKEQPINEPNYR